MKNKAYKYENLQIGNFLISFGYYLRDFKYSFPVSMNLYQQTPLDHKIGDVFGAMAGKYFIIEFKNDESGIKNELKKPQRNRLIERLKNEYQHLISSSVKGHLICFSVFEELTGLDYKLVPYITIDRNDCSDYILTNTYHFLEALLVEQIIGCSFQEISNYIDLLNKCVKKEGQDEAGSISGIFMNFSEKEGIRYLPFDDLDFLNQRIKLDREIQLDLEISSQKSRGMDFGR